MNTGIILGGGIAAFVLWVVAVAAWITHAVWTIKLLMSIEPALVQQLVLGAAGLIFPPVGTIHGVMLWFM